MGNLAQKIKTFFIAPSSEELLPFKNDNSISNQSNENNQIYTNESQKKELNNSNLNKLQILKQQQLTSDKIQCPVRMLTAMQGRPYNTEIYKPQSQQIANTIQKLN